MGLLKVVNLGTPSRASYSVIFKDQDETQDNLICLSKSGVRLLHRMVQASRESGFDKSPDFETVLGNQLLLCKNGTEVYDLILSKDITILSFVEEAYNLVENPNQKEEVKKPKLSSSDIKFFNTTIARLACKLAPASETDSITDLMLATGLDAALDLVSSLDAKSVINLARDIAKKGGLDSKTKKIRFKKES